VVTLEMTPSQAIAQLERDLHLSPSELADALNASPRTVERWRASETYPQRDARQRLAELIALDTRLHDTFDSPDAIRTWLHSSNRYLGGITPAEAARIGRIDRVEAALEALDSGIFL
jgi:transcriptional regulator with XRE-family HTH domain